MNGTLSYHTLKVSKDSEVKRALFSKYESKVPGYAMSLGAVAILKGSKQVSITKTIGWYGGDTDKKTATYVLKKGTYKVGIKMGTYGVLDQNGTVLPNEYKVQLAITPKADGGATKAKAVTLKNKKLKSGILAVTKTAGSGSRGDWYKFGTNGDFVFSVFYWNFKVHHSGGNSPK